MIETPMPRLFSSRPIDAVVIPLPIEETTPPVTKMYFGRRPLSIVQLLSSRPRRSAPCLAHAHLAHRPPSGYGQGRQVE
jgi:hypothetical protein